MEVATSKYRGQFEFAWAGADENLEVTERFTLVDRNTLLYQAAIDDPTAYTARWTVVQPMTRTTTRMFEYACHEANYALRNILSSARANDAPDSQGPR